MRQRGYAVAFVLVLLIACGGGIVGGRWAWQRLRQDFAPGPAWTPPTATPTALPQAPPATRVAVATPTRPPSPPVPAATRPTAPAAIAPSPSPALRPASPTPTPTEPPSVTPTPSGTPTPVAGEPVGGMAYLLTRPVRHSAGDCPGSPVPYVLGIITDHAGNTLPGVRLWLVDEYGNGAWTVSKSGAADGGRYDFPLSGPPRRFYLGVVDADGRPISPRVGIQHAGGPDPQANCHWTDWQRQ